MQQQSEAYPDKKKPKIPCIYQEGIIHATAYAELYKHEFSLGFMIHTPVHHCRQLCSQLINFWKKKKSETNELVCVSSENIRLWREAYSLS